MIKIMRSIKINSGKDAEAIEWSIKCARFMTENSPGGTLEAWQSLDGDIRQIHFVGTSESMGDFDKGMGFMGNDEGYAELIKEAIEKDLFDADSDRRHFFKKLG